MTLEGAHFVSVRSPSFLDSPVQNYLNSSAVIGTSSANSLLFVWPASQLPMQTSESTSGLTGLELATPWL